ncbi:hypothetical protein [Actinotalea sp. K2]|uniref:COG1470 family protein n=1 Tax=Actinotalea sp. K2 TaxID=2939438 RepID=UPI002017BDDB|nr:hypothetical protein [Actinotalea sp. K2]MCL3860412.1 hypothetical protein [Actinotalea sp. K2]
MISPEVRLTGPTVPLTGGSRLSGRLVVRNTGREVERYEVVATGPLAGWVTLQESEVRIWPGEQREVGLTVTLPTGPAPPAGASEIRVVAIAGDGAWGEARHPVQVAPHPQAELQAPVPHAIGTARRALVHLVVANPGNTPLDLELVARDREGRLAHEVHRSGARLALAPGQAFTVPLLLRCTRPTWLGRSVPRDYTVEAVGTVAASTGGVLVQEPVLRPWWILVLVAVLLLVGTVFSGDAMFVAMLIGVTTLAVVALRRYSRLVRGGPGGR